jgi:hypothetical protein
MLLIFFARWSVMAKLFTDRSDNDIKNKWYSMKRKDERNGTYECKNPFGVMNVLPNPTTIAVDYSSSDRRGITSSGLATHDQSSPMECVDDTKVASMPSGEQCSLYDDVTEV